MNPPTQSLIRRMSVATLAAALALGLGACSGSGDSSSAGSAQRGSVAEGGAAPDAAKPQASSGVSTDSVVQGPMMVRRADTAVVVEDVRAAALDLRGIATSAGGSVLNESISTEDDSTRPTYGSVTIQVPSAKLDESLDRIEKLGDMVSRDTSAEDVKSQFVDTESRVKSMEAGVDRIRALMAQASSIQDLIALESELSRRQTDLEAMQAQLAALKDQVAMSPISVRLTTNRVELGTDGGGFLGGLRAGWTAFLVSIRLLLTAVGALLPFAVAAALVAAPIVWFARHRRARRAASAPARPVRPHASMPYPSPSPAPAPEPVAVHEPAAPGPTTAKTDDPA